MTYFCAPISSIDHRLRGNVTPVSPALMSSVDCCCQQKSRIRTLAPLHKKLGNRRGTARCVVSVEMKSCQLPRNSTETTCTTSPEQIEVMKLEGYTGPLCNKHVHSTVMPSSPFYCPVGVINKPKTVELWISPYRRLAVAKFSKSTI